jgi:uncharacterized protein with FMN-binding domain
VKKSLVTAVVTTVFVVYSLYQRAFGAAQAPSGALPSPYVATSAAQGASGHSTPPPIPASAANPAQSDSAQVLPGDTPTSVPQPTPTTTQQAGSLYKDGSYTGVVANAFYGNVQVQATIANGQLTNVKFLEWPNDRSRSVRINQQALPMLVQEAIQAQSGNVDVVSGATDSSYAFAQSLQSALGQAQTVGGQAQSASGGAKGSE